MKVLVFFSGGKDSQAALIWAVKTYGVANCEAVFFDTNWEAPYTVKHVNDVCNQMGVKLTTLTSKRFPGGFLELAKYKDRFPYVQARFCTEELKSKPSIDYVLSHTENLIIVEGIRAKESANRARMDAQCTYFKYYYEPLENGKKYTYQQQKVWEWTKKYNADLIRPCFQWTAQDVIDYILANGQQPNPLYYQGFTRVGCFPCMMARLSEIKLLVLNHPEAWQKFKDAEKYVGRNFFQPGDKMIPKHAYKGDYPTAEDVENYIKNKSATIDMFAEEKEEQTCMSAFAGLCE